MKKYFFILVLFVLSVGNTFSINQVPDILIIDTDTVFMKSYPLDDLKLQLFPFDYGNGKGFPDENCKRGYQAVWEVIDYKLFLREIRKVGTPGETVDLKDFFEKNKCEAEIRDGMVFAKWYSASLVYYFSDSMDYIHKPSLRFFWDKPKVKFEKGLMTVNRLGIVEEHKL